MIYVKPKAINMATNPIMIPSFDQLLVFFLFLLTETKHFFFFLQFLGTSFSTQSPSFDFNRLLDDR